MNLQELIEKMRTELKDELGVSTGAYMVLRTNVEEMDNIRTDPRNYKNVNFLNTSRLLVEKFEFVSGFLWGLYSTGFITMQQRDALTAEAIKLTRLDEALSEQAL